MNKETILKVQDCLGLERQIVGVRFLVYEKDFENSPAEEFKGKIRLCGFISKAGKGRKFKVTKENFGCSGGPTQTGMSVASEGFKSGQIHKYSGLYSDLAIARNISDSLMRIPQKIYGLEIMPLSEMDDADVVVVIGFAESIMKLVQGYTYSYGVPQNYISVGNAAACSDMVSKPFMKNDINLSFMCCGARTSTLSDHGELGMGIPMNKFYGIADGVLAIYSK